MKNRNDRGLAGVLLVAAVATLPALLSLLIASSRRPAIRRGCADICDNCPDYASGW